MLRPGSSLFIVPAALLIFSLICLLGYDEVNAQPSAQDFIRGKVHVQHGDPGGVWVIAQTEELGTPFAKIVVTDDKGNFLLPDLPDANYQVWVRGYGLVDSQPVEARPSNKNVNLRAQVASTPQEAAKIYPPAYWYGLLDLPTDADVEALAPASIQNAAHWQNRTKLGCQLCHTMGDHHTRGHDRIHPQQWDSLLNLAGTMSGIANGMGRDLVIDVHTDWATRIAQGEVPPVSPPRPEGIERNIVITQWLWGDALAYIHDHISTDKRFPDMEIYRFGKQWAVDIGMDRLIVMDSQNHETFMIDVPTRGGFDVSWCDQPGFCSLAAYHNPANPHNPMLDDQGIVWITTQIRERILPDHCITAGDPDITASRRGMGFYNTNTGEFGLIDTCYDTHHLQFDMDGILWMSGDSQVFGWLNPAAIDLENCGVESCPDETSVHFGAPGPASGAAQGWYRVIVDSDGDGIADTPVTGFNYGLIPSWAGDNAVWSAFASYPGQIRYLDTETGMFEAYNPPYPGQGPRGIEVDLDGNPWTCLSGSSHVAKFERDKCAQTWGTGDQCPEGWTLWSIPGPEFKGIEDEEYRRVDHHYYVWIDHFDTLGLGEGVVVCQGTNSDSQIAFNPDTEEFTRVTTPYPSPMFTRLMDGRIDDPDAGWKGKGWWISQNIDPVKFVHHEPTAPEQNWMGWLQQVQLRPDPLAK